MEQFPFSLPVAAAFAEKPSSAESRRRREKDRQKPAETGKTGKYRRIPAKTKPFSSAVSGSGNGRNDSGGGYGGDIGGSGGGYEHDDGSIRVALSVGAAEEAAMATAGSLMPIIFFFG